MSREKQQELRIWRKENGFCTQCGKKLPDGCVFATCEKCRASGRSRYQSRKESRLCAVCGGKLPDGYTSVTCEDCKNYRKLYRRFLKKEQLCVCCGKQDAYTINKHTLCADCSERIAASGRKRMAQNAGLAERKRLRSKELYNSRKEQGLCTDCRKILPEGDHHVLCSGCRARHRRRYAMAADKRYGSDRLTKWNVSAFGICSLCFKAPAERGKLCESCYKKMLSNLEKVHKALAQKNANHPWRVAESARQEEVRRKHGWEKRPDKK